MTILKDKLHEQVQLMDHTRPHVQSSPFHLHIEFESAKKAKDIKNILLKIKAVRVWNYIDPYFKIDLF
jgi:hypothetical protein